jgi:TorA maturation chaperone TorD
VSPESTTLDFVSSAEEARQRSGVYGLLAAVFGTEPTAQLLDFLREPAARAALTPAGAGLEDGLGSTDEERIEILATEFCRLFLGPGKHISPYSSVHMDGGSVLWGATTEWVRSCFLEAGFEPPASRLNPPDHIANELAFLCELTGAEAAAADANDFEAWERLRAAQSGFLGEHLLKWADRFFDAVAGEAGIALYRDFANLAKAFLESEWDHLKPSRPQG